MPDTSERLADRLRDEGQKTIAFFQALEGDQWEARIYTDGSQWTVRQVLAHIVDTESAIARLMEDVLKGGAGVPEDFDIDRYNKSRTAKMLDIPASSLLEQFSLRRQATIDLVSGMQPGNLFQQGRHPFLGITTIEEMVKLMYRHNQIHQRDIRRTLAGITR